MRRTHEEFANMIDERLDEYKEWVASLPTWVQQQIKRAKQQQNEAQA